MSAPIVCWGEVLWDAFPAGDRLGGCAANVAFHVAALGGHAVLVSRVGDDEPGHTALAELASAGVDVRHVQLDADAPTGRVRVSGPPDAPRFEPTTQAAWDRIALTPPVTALLRTAGALVFGTLAQRTPLGTGALSTALAAAGPGTRRLCDLNLRPPFAPSASTSLTGLHAAGAEGPGLAPAAAAIVLGSVRRADVVKLNEREAAVVAATLGVDDPIAALHHAGAWRVALTRGSAGAVLSERGAPPVEHPGCAAGGDAPVASDADSVGAGDAFTAVLALLAVTAPDQPLADCLARANRYAAFVAGQPGAMPTPPPALIRAVAP